MIAFMGFEVLQTYVLGRYLFEFRSNNTLLPIVADFMGLIGEMYHAENTSATVLTTLNDALEVVNTVIVVVLKCWMRTYRGNLMERHDLPFLKSKNTNFENEIFTAPTW